jgi:hypothetical protein
MNTDKHGFLDSVTRSVVADYCESHVTEKLDPSDESADGTASNAPLELSMVIAKTLANDPITPVVPPIVASFVPVTPVLSSPKRTVWKSARGRMPPREVQQGASAIHSADDRFAPRTVELLV